MARKQAKKLICITQKEDENLSHAESGKLINENVRMLKECQTPEEITKLLKTANKYMLYLIHMRLGLGFPIWTRERTRDFYIRIIGDYIANGCENPQLTKEEEDANRLGCKTIGQFMREAYDRECGSV